MITVSTMHSITKTLFGWYSINYELIGLQKLNSKHSDAGTIFTLLCIVMAYFILMISLKIGWLEEIFLPTTVQCDSFNNNTKFDCYSSKGNKHSVNNEHDTQWIIEGIRFSNHLNPNEEIGIEHNINQNLFKETQSCYKRSGLSLLPL